MIRAMFDDVTVGSYPRRVRTLLRHALGAIGVDESLSDDQFTEWGDFSP